MLHQEPDLTFVAGGAVYFLVVPHNGNREGSCATDGAGNPRPAAADACWPQLPGGC